MAKLNKDQRWELTKILEQAANEYVLSDAISELISQRDEAKSWRCVEESLPEPMQEVDIVVVRTSDGKFVGQWSQIAWRRLDGLWIGDEDIVERIEPWDKMDRRQISHWAKRRELPPEPSASSEGESNG